MKARIPEIKTTINREEYEAMMYTLIASMIKCQLASERQIIEFIGSSITSMDIINILIDLAINAEYHQVYLTLLERKEQLNGFSQTNNFEL